MKDKLIQLRHIQHKSVEHCLEQMSANFGFSVEATKYIMYGTLAYIHTQVI